MSQPQALPPPHLWINKLAVSRGERVLFRDLDLIATARECLFVRGPNGAGKSSLLLALAGILRPEAGQIEYRAIGAEERERHLHLVGHQSAVKPRLTLAENLQFWVATCGRPGISPSAALDRVGLGGLDAIEAGHLSAGQTRRLALARLLVAEREIWLLDEPTASLDAKGEALVGELISEHVAHIDRIAIVATHQDIPLPDQVTRTLVLG